MSKVKNGGLVHYGAEPVEQQQFGTAGVEGVNTNIQGCRVLGQWALASPTTGIRGASSCLTKQATRSKMG